jgi:4-amino-4-deoxy-L-arabinose transferase-like glycosyltransferase
MNAGRKLTFLILIVTLLTFTVSLTTELSLGDEGYHYRFAKNIFKTGKRVAYDPLYGSGHPPAYLYNTEPLWNILLAIIWRLFGKLSFPVAQFYHTIYYSLLILFTYLLGKELFGEKEGLYSALIIATAPAIIVFSIVFYQDVPATCLSTLCLLLIIRKRFFLSGIVLGMMYLTKRTTYFFLPAYFILILYLTEKKFWKRAYYVFVSFIPAILFILPDMLWREKHLNYSIPFEFEGKKILVSNVGTLCGIWERISFKYWSYRTKEYLNSSLFNPADVVKYFGFVLLFSLAIYIFFRVFKKKDLIIWLPVSCYFLFYCLIFSPASDIRYLLPIFPLLSILSSKAIMNFCKKKRLKILIITVCFLQFISTLLFVRAKRQIPGGIKEGFTYIRYNTSPDALILYPEYTLIEATNRRFAWAGSLPNLLNKLFWNDKEAEVRDLLKDNNISYIVIKKERIYDDSKAHHFGGYPKSFIERLPSLPFLKLVFDNKEISIWKVN